jgi:apolipoprotein N-acyltransferase
LVSAPRTLAPAALGGLLIALSLPPWPVSTGAWPLGLVGAAIVFAAVDGRRLRARIGGGMAAGLGLYLPGLWWMRDFSWPGFVVTVVLEAAILAGALALAPLGARARPGARIAAFPAALVLAEAVRGAWPFGGLPLAGIELGQVAGPLAPAARLGGRFLIVALVGLAGVAVASAVVAVGPEIPPGGGEAGGRRARARARAAGGSSPGVHRRGVVAGSRTGTDGRRGVRGLTSSLAATAVVVAVTVGGAAAPDGRPDGTLTVAAVQGGGLRGLRAVGRDPGPVFQAHLRAGASVGPGVDLVLWPEDVVDVAGPLAGSPEERSVAAQASDLGATVVVGVVEEVGDDRFRNAAVVFGPDGTVVDRYDKVHRVPFGEYIPARALFARLADVSAVPRDAIAGRGPGVIDTPRGRLGVLVSYEVFFQDRGRDAVRAGGRLLLVPTNASSFADAQVPAHELAVARLRALETGRWVVQAAPTGYSAIVDHRGRVRSRSGLGEAAVLRHQVGLRAGRTLFVTLGPSPVLLLAVAILAVARIRRRKPERGNDRFADEVEGEADKEHKEEDPC